MSRQGSFVKSLTPQHGHKTTFLVIRINNNYSYKKSFQITKILGTIVMIFVIRRENASLIVLTLSTLKVMNTK